MSLCKRGFTLIELLVVVSILSILTLIAMPNMTLALTRAKVARAQNDMRVVSNVLEIYNVDHNQYPGIGNMYQAMEQYHKGQVIDIFTKHSNIRYENSKETWYGMPAVDAELGTSHTEEMGLYWLLGSVGPDVDWYNTVAVKMDSEAENPCFYEPISSPYRDYDPTNGTLSVGNVFRTNKNFEKLNPPEDFYTEVYGPPTPIPDEDDDDNDEDSSE